MIIVSGGQTGVDRAALDAAIHCGIPIAGMVPKGWKTENNEDADMLRRKYPSLIESMSSSYPPRTRWNVKHADFVMLITRDGIGSHRGTKLTMDMANNYGIRWGMVNLHDEFSRSRAMAFIRQASHARNDYDYRIMIAGPRESGDRGIYRLSYDFLMLAFPPMV